jgi:PAS domain S-box-containing protein
MDRLCPSVFVGLLDLDGKLRYANRAALEAAGVSAEAVIGKPFESMPWWSASERGRRRLRTAIKEASKGTSSRFDAHIVDAGGCSMIVDFALEPVFGVDPAEHYLIASASNVTERRRIDLGNRARRGTDRERLRLEADLHRATEAGDFCLHYQPRLCAQSGALESFEALLRWHRTGHGWVSPAQFVPIAEQTGLIVPIGDWVARTALTQARAWSVDHADRFGISINLSARQFRRRDLAASIGGMLHETGIDASRVELELTESTLIDNIEEAIATMHALKSLGVRLSLDDFGTGFSSLSYLRRFPIDRLKIDKSFVQQIDADDATEAIIDTIISMAHRLGLRVAAEGVETHRQLQSLKDKGCDEVQGFLLCAPLPAEDQALWAPCGDARSRQAIVWGHCATRSNAHDLDI